MDSKLHILMLEDVAEDVELMERELRKGGLTYTAKRVVSRESFQKELKNCVPGLILADYKLPGFDGLSALAIAQKECPDTPFILVSGTLGEERAIEALRKGATDYVLKNNLSRLVPAVKRALQEAEERANRKQIETVLRTSESQLSNAMKIAHLGYWEYDVASDLFTFNDHFYAIFRTTAEEVGGYTMSFAPYAQRFVHPDDVSVVGDEIQKAIKTTDPLYSRQIEHRIIYADGETGYITSRFFIVKDDQGRTVKTFGANQDVTERKKAEESLRQSEAELREAQRVANVGSWELNWETGDVIWSEEIYRIFGIDPALSAPTYKEHSLILEPASKTQFDSAINKTLRTGDPFEVDLELIRPDGITGWITVRGEIKRKDAGFTLLRGTAHDITKRKQAEIALQTSEAELYDTYFAEATIHTILSESLKNMPLEEFLQKALNMALSVPWIDFQNMGNIQLVENQSEILVMKAQANLPERLKKSYAHVPFGKYLCGRAAVMQEIQFAAILDKQHDICHEEIPPYNQYAIPIIYSSNTLGVLNLFLQKGYVRDKRVEEFLGIVADTLAGIIMRKKAEERISYLAYYDALTGLPNRNLFIDRLNQGIARAEPTSKVVAVLIADIDRFKSINDIYGTEVGDRVLKKVAERLSAAVRKGDTIARLGNDEFGIALLDVAHLDDTISVMEKIMKYISHPLKIGNDEITVTYSTGISIYPHDNKNPQDLLKSAGLALGIAKKEGKQNYRFYTKDLNVKATEFLLMEKNLYNAIKNEEFFLHYQPYWDINTQKIIGIEALVRWQSRDMGLISPGQFIPVLEDTGMILEVGEWILRTATRQVKEWQDKGYPVVPVSVNLSLIQFRQKNLAEMVKQALTECGYYPSLLTLEITESAFMQDIEFTSSVLKELKDIGVSVSIDDFGTGYSSLAYLKRFPIDNLKIDISFIREMVKDPDSASIVMAIITMAHTLNLKTIAEGIETEEQWKFLRLLRCDMGQGFYFSKPLPAEEFKKLLI